MRRNATIYDSSRAARRDLGELRRAPGGTRAALPSPPPRSGLMRTRTNIKAGVNVSGQVTGNITASDKVEIKSDCTVVGDIRAPRIL
jgi:hypothetical protein